MKSTGITRRIDDLGRVVIPKEIRRSLKIREGDAFEIYVDEVSGMVCYQKLDVNNDICTELDRLLDKYDYDFDEVSVVMLLRERSRVVNRLVSGLSKISWNTLEHIKLRFVLCMEILLRKMEC